MTKDGGAAFPSEQGVDHTGNWNQTYESGMTLRDYFAGQALLAMNIVEYVSYEQMAETAYNIADSMLKEREK